MNSSCQDQTLDHPSLVFCCDFNSTMLQLVGKLAVCFTRFACYLRDLQWETQVYEWLVLPFRTTSSPCYGIYVLKKHVKEHPRSTPDIIQSVEYTFYVDNCLESHPTAAAAQTRVDELYALLADGGFEIRQWAVGHNSNHILKLDYMCRDKAKVKRSHWKIACCPN